MISFKKFIQIFGAMPALALVVLALAVASPDAGAQVFTYSTNVRTVKVGILIPRGFQAPARAANLFNALDQRSDLKPSGWSFVNPLAPDRVDTTMAARWNQGGVTNPPSPTVGTPYRAGDVLRKDMAGYWEVPIDTATAEQLSQFDLLYLGRSQIENGFGQSGVLSNPEREKLRKAVDSGVVLWVEETTSPLNLFLKLDYRGNSGSGVPRIAQPLHPLLNSPYALGQSDLNNLFGGGIADISPSTQADSIDNTVINSVIQDQANATEVAAGAYGSGYVVMSSQIGVAINSSVLQGSQAFPWAAGNAGGYSGNDFTRIPVSALKFAYNAVSINQESPQERGGTRRTASTGEQIGAPLTRKWTFPDGPTDPTAATANWDRSHLFPNSAAPAVFKGVVYVPAANGHLYAFDLNPTRDLDGDGNPDDGWGNNGPTARPFDLSNGAPYDILWDAALGDAIKADQKLISTPTVATIQDPSRGPVDVVYITTQDGEMYAFEALPRSGGHLSGAAVPYWKSPVKIGDPYPTAIPGVPLRIPAPVFGEGRLFAASDIGAEGVVSELDPVTGRIVWKYQKSTKPIGSVPPSIGPIVATPALAWVHDTGTEASDLVLYVPCFSEPAQGQTARIFAFLLSVRGERLTDTGDHKQFRSRYWLAPTNLPWGRYIIHAGPSISATLIPGRPGWVDLGTMVDPGTPVLADYDLDPTSDNFKPRSAFYGFPGSNGEYPNFISSPLVGPDDTIYAVATDLQRNISSLYAFRDQSPIAYVKWRYTLPVGTNVLGPPAYYNGAVYVGTSAGHIIGFDANPTFYIDVSGALDESRKFQIQLLQDDPSLPKAYQTVAFTYNTAMFDAANVTDVDPITHLTRLHMRLNIKTFSLSGSTSLDAALPVRVRYPSAGQTAQAEETSDIRSSTEICGNPISLFQSTASNRTANKLFEQAIPTGAGAAIVSGPSVAGDSLYITTGDGGIYVLPADPCALTGSGRFLNLGGPTPATIPGPGQLSVGPVGPIRGSVVFSNGNLIANTPGGVMVFQQPVTLVADAGRLLEVRNTFGGEGGGNTAGSEIVWSLPETTRYNSLPQPGLQTFPAFSGLLPVPEKTSFSHPAAVRRLSSTNFLVADTGNNRVVEVDRAGTVLWEMSGFADPYSILGGAEPLTLNTPTDVQRWTAIGPGGAAELHTLVVDSGNHRIVEIRDTFANNLRTSSPDYHVLVWASRTTQPDSTSGTPHYYDYRDAQRVPGGIPGLPPGEYTIATATNWRINSIDGSIPDTPGSSLVILSGPRRDASGQILRNGNGTFVDPGGTVVAFARDLTFKGGATAPINNPTSFERFYTGSGAVNWKGLLTDGEGFYEVQGALNPASFEITLNVTGGRSGRNPQPLVPPDSKALGVVMAKRLPSGNTLIVNQALGQVFEFDLKLGILPLSPATRGTHALAQPASADRGF